MRVFIAASFLRMRQALAQRTEDPASGLQFPERESCDKAVGPLRLYPVGRLVDRLPLRR
jgi:hypothetical protein